MKRSSLRRIIACLMVCQLGIHHALAATDLTDVPMAVSTSVKPNIMFILDNSGSMNWDSITGTDGLARYSNTVVDFYSYLVNGMYYNPNIVYTPGIGKTTFSTTTPQGTAMANADSSSTGALDDPYLAPTGSRTDLTKYCYYSPATAPWNVKTSGGSKNCNIGSVSGGYSKGPIAVYAYYYDYTGAGTPTPGSSTSYTRRDILPAAAPFTRTSSRTDCTVSGSTASCTYAQEIQNFANWWSYYRTRINTMKTSMGQAFSSLSNKYRVGFSTINDATHSGNPSGANYISIGDFDTTKKTSWFTQLYSIDPLNGTPLQDALNRVGNYYKGSGMGYSGGVGSDDPVQYSCQPNFAIMSTDGYWNSLSLTAVGDQDLTVPTVPTSALTPVPDPGVTAGATWPRPFYEGTSVSSNSLADVAAYYWVTDLRSTLTNNVPVSTEDQASWQHMATFTIGLGASGSKPYRSDYLTATSGFYHDVVAGTDNWPLPVADSSTAIDDLWHAAVNGHGQYFSAKDPNSIKSSLINVLNNIVSRTSAAAAVAVANANITSGDNTSYASSYNSGTWTGDLDAFALDTATGIASTTSLWTSGSAQTQLDLRTAAATDRFIVTYSGTGYSSTSGVQFQPSTATVAGAVVSKMSAAQTARFETPPSGTGDSASVVAYLRGDRSLESPAGSYRTRAHVLGDIIDAEPIVVRPPSRHYVDSGYAAFRTTNASRSKMVVQAANDGMVHVFNGTTGSENWAFVPNLLIDMSDPLNPVASTLNMLTRKTYAHQMYVDATPILGDVDFSATDGISGSPAPDWHTILVGGLGKGGRGVYALDLTSPVASSEDDASKKVLWEFPNSSTSATIRARMGYVYGRPILVKTAAKGWVVLVASGYNNGTISGGDSSTGTCSTASDCNGHGYLYVLNARTGDVITTIDTTVGTDTNPSGLAHISAFVEDAEFSAQVLQVYGGDLLGNVWRFDLSDPSVTNWDVHRLAILKDGTGGSAATQAITTEPQLASVKINGSTKRFIYIGTGKYLGSSDVTTTQVQSFYGLVDDLSKPSGITPVIADNVRTHLQVQTFTTSGTTRVASSNTIDWATLKGWYIDLPLSGERVNTTPALVSGALVFTTNIPTSDPCIPGGSSWLNVLDYKTGGLLEGSTTSWSSTFLGSALASRPVVVLTSTGLKAEVRTSGVTTVTTGLGISTTPPAGSRTAWREILH